MTTRKTVSRATLVEYANKQIDYITRSAIRGEITWQEANFRRDAICGLLQAVLFAYTDGYAGFRYMSTEYSEPGVLRPGFDDLARQYY